MAPRLSLGVRAAIAIAAALLTTPVPAHGAPLHPVGADTVTLVGAGDIAVCGSYTADSATAAVVSSVLAEQASNVAFTAGDNVYPDGSSNWYAACYDPTWGAFRLRTRPVPGNHDYYNNPTGAGYFGYFGSQGGALGSGLVSLRRRDVARLRADERVRARFALLRAPVPLAARGPREQPA